MDTSRFRAPEAGRIVRAEGGYRAFVPSPLPPRIDWDADLVLALSRADAALSELSGAGAQLPNPHLLISPSLRQEAVLSSRIEGTRSSLSDVLIDELREPNLESATGDVREVRNYVRAMERGLERLSSLPLSLRLVRELHATLMQGARGAHATPGEFRRSQNWIGRPGSTIETAAYVPPPPDEMIEALGAWERFLHERDVMPDLVQCALMHEQFEAIHPFLDGNGRVGRLLITLFLVERGRLAQPLLYLSAFFERNRGEYYDALQAVRTDGDWKGWLLYFLRGVEEVARRSVRQAYDLMEVRERLRAVSGSAKATALVDELFLSPYLDVATAARLLKVSDPTARKAVERLVAAGALIEVTGRTWGRIYECRPIMDVLERELPSAG
ncbi:MAG: Fic family protein [Actinobacteria bacterium]|nr:MAG: Fic family protein [Actinomycetota bacterium]